MNLVKFLPYITLLTLSTIGTAAIQASDSTRSEIYANGGGFIIEGDLDARVKIIAPNIGAFVLLGTAVPFVIGIADWDSFSEGGSGTLIQAESFLRLQPGTKLSIPKDNEPGYYESELIDHKSMRPVGTLRYYKTEDYPRTPSWLIHLCTGPYENTCTLIYSATTKSYSIDFHTPAPEPTLPQCKP